MKSAYLALIVAACAYSETSHAQGPLTPPSGVPAPVMKTLDQIEPRTPIPASPAVPVAGPHFTITQPGSYYLTGNVTVSSGNAIRIAVSGVTLDLNGFSLLSSSASSSGSAILINSANSGSHGGTNIRNGHIRPLEPSGTNIGFENGIGVNGLPNNIVIQEVAVERLNGDGINLQNTIGSVVQNCSVDNLGGTGIRATIVKGCNAMRIQGTAIFGTAVSDSRGGSLANGNGIFGTTVTNSSGISSSGNGVGGASVSNSYGLSTSGSGINADNVNNSRGFSTSGNGVTAANVQNSSGSSTSGLGISASGTASYCRGERNGGVAISAAIAVACTVDGTGTISSPQKHLGTP